MSTAQQLDTLGDVFSIDGALVSRGPYNTVIRLETGLATLYIKRYQHAGSIFRRYLGSSRVRREWENLLRFEGWGIRTPTLLAYGEEYHSGYFRRGVIITEAVRDSINLQDLANKHPQYLVNRRFLQPLLLQIARQTRILHDNGFAHNDLDWRNILVRLPQETGMPEIFFFDCPNGRFWPWPFLQFRIIKDLAHLEKSARQHLPVRMRLWFYKRYVGKKKLDRHDRLRLKKIAAYCDKKSWGEKPNAGTTARD